MSDKIICKKCNGTGTINIFIISWGGLSFCPECKGKGKIIKKIP